MISPELFFLLARIEGILWSVSDFFIVFFFLKLINVIRLKSKLKPYKKMFYFLYFSFLITPLLLFTTNLFEFLLIQIIVLNIQYFILLYVLFNNYKLMYNALKSI